MNNTSKHNTLIDEMNLPNYLYKDLIALENGKSNPKCTYMDCLLSEAGASINIALADQDINLEEAKYLYSNFLDKEYGQ